MQRQTSIHNPCCVSNYLASITSLQAQHDCYTFQALQDDLIAFAWLQV